LIEIIVIVYFYPLYQSFQEEFLKLKEINILTNSPSPDCDLSHTLFYKLDEVFLLFSPGLWKDRS